MEDREGRIGYWVSGVAHGSLILWAILGGALFRPQPDHPVRTTQVSTVTGAEFEALAAAARGAGPVGAEAT
ncbi:protein TolA, partial [Paracoccus liaowanqingii]